MVVLSAAVTTRSGKVLVARQFVEVSRSRIEGLLAAFPKLIGTGKQHTFIETENVRYVYQPLEELFVVLITTKTSNILEDLDTLHLFSRIIPDYCRSIEEEEIVNERFQLIFAFDEIISLGYRENVLGSQVKTFMEMESHDEKIQEMIARNKEQEAKEQAKLRIKQMDQQRKDNKKKGIPMGSSGGFGGGSMSAGGSSFSSSSISPSSSSSDRIHPEATPEYSAPSKPSVGGGGKGMQLGKKKDSRDFLAAMKSEEGLEDLLDEPSPSSAAPASRAAAAAPAAPSEGLQITVEEKVTVVANRDGGIQNLEIKGDLVLRVTDPAKASLKIVLPAPEDKGIQFKTHPNVDKRLWSVENTIGLKDPSRPFPLSQPVGVLKWRLQSKDEALVPLTINCWPSPSGDGTCDVNIEYELERDVELHHVVISIPIPPGPKAPVVTSVDGEFRFNKAQGVLEWLVGQVDPSARSGSLEFSCGGDDASQFFPVHVDFTGGVSLCGISIAQVLSADSNAPLTFASQFSLSTEDYSVV